MIKTRLTELVGLKYPIIQAGMGPYPVTSLCIAAANAGCLGLCSTFATTSRETNPIVFEDFCKQAHAETTDDDVTIFKKMFTRVFEETKAKRALANAASQPAWPAPTTMMSKNCSRFFMLFLLYESTSINDAYIFSASVYNYIVFPACSQFLLL